ncbi:hypothetical protein KGM48_00205 [Patescibacteria group bacterium]|nr:hypothetical protein [Patescibacteria group bacterium]
MGGIVRNWRVILASLFSAVLIGSAFLLARGAAAPSVAEASTETELLRAIATKDSNGDGLPDWQKTLYGIPIDSTTTDYFNLGMTDGEAVAKGLIVPKAIADIPVATATPATLGVDDLPPAPADGTLTAAFSKTFFMLYLQAKQNAGGADLTDAQMSDVVNRAVNMLSSSVAITPKYKNPADLVIGASGSSALLSFAADAENLLRKNSNNATTTELAYLKEAENGNATALTFIAAIAKSYRDSATGLVVLPVPQELAGQDLELINALMHMSKVINDFTLVNTDPLAAILALTQYQSSVQGLAKAFTDIGSVYAAAGIHLAAGSPGASFVNLMSGVSGTSGAPQP